MNYIVLDLEWNQSPKGKEFSIPGIPFEIIEIGAVKVDEQFNTVDEYHQIIKPTVYTAFHSKIKDMLSISYEDLCNGEDFKSAAEAFLKWCGDDYRFVTWGCLDLTELQRNMKFYNMEMQLEFPLLFYDLQKMYSIRYSDGKTRSSLKNVIENMQLPENDTFHSALGDARYTAQILKKMDFNAVKIFESIDTFRIPANRKEEIRINFGTYEKYISKGFKSRDTAVNDRVVRSCRCYMCGKPMKRIIKWFATGSKNYYGLFKCDEHGLFKGRFRARQSDEGNYFVIKIMKHTDEAGGEKISERQQKEREHRRRKRQEEKARGSKGSDPINFL